MFYKVECLTCCSASWTIHFRVAQVWVVLSQVETDDNGCRGTIALASVKVVLKYSTLSRLVTYTFSFIRQITPCLCLLSRLDLCCRPGVSVMLPRPGSPTCLATAYLKRARLHHSPSTRVYWRRYGCSRHCFLLVAHFIGRRLLLWVCRVGMPLTRKISHPPVRVEGLRFLTMLESCFVFWRVLYSGLNICFLRWCWLVVNCVDRQHFSCVLIVWLVLYKHS